MISGLFINRKRYPLSKYVLITLVAIGISLFMYNPHVRLRPPHQLIELSNSHGPLGGQGSEARTLYRLRDALGLAAPRRRHRTHPGACP